MSADFRTELLDGVAAIAAAEWDALAAATPGSTVFQRHRFLRALEAAGCVGPGSGWKPLALTLRDGAGNLAAACAVYVKSHSYGEYVFDWAWAQAYADHGLRYYPKLLLAVPFTPVGGAKLLGRDAPARRALLAALQAVAERSGVSSLHALFLDPQEAEWCSGQSWMARTTLQFHWRNPATPGAAPWTTFDAFLASLRHDKRKKIRQELRQVADAGVRLRPVHGSDIRAQDWALFADCYADTYAAHGSTPYLNAEFFQRLGSDLPEHCLLFIAERDGVDFAASLILLDPQRKTAYGRYWGALAHVPALHFAACYYAPIAWCIEHGYTVFEGGAQGEHKVARGLQPVATQSAHWLAHPAFAEAVEDYLQRETAALSAREEALREHLPFRQEIA